MRRSLLTVVMLASIAAALSGDSLPAGSIRRYFARPDTAGQPLHGLILDRASLNTHSDPLPHGTGVVTISTTDTRSNSLFPEHLVVTRHPRGYLLQQSTTPEGWYLALLDIERPAWVNPELLLPVGIGQEWVVRTVLEAVHFRDADAEIVLEAGVWSGPPGQRMLRPPESLEVLLDGAEILRLDYLTAELTAADGVSLLFRENRYRITGLHWQDDAVLRVRVFTPGGTAVERSYALPSRNP